MEPFLISLTNDEALVLFEWLASADSNSNSNMPDEATQKVLWQLEGLLEKGLLQVLDPNYNELLCAAKESVLNK